MSCYNQICAINDPVIMRLQYTIPLKVVSARTYAQITVFLPERKLHKTSMNNSLIRF